MRDALVSDAMPQKSCPTVEMMRTNLTHAGPIALDSTAIAVPPPSLIAFASDAANVSASSRNQPKTADQKIDRHTPLAAPISASRVSSEMCAHESKPVIVYCVSRKP